MMNDERLALRLSADDRAHLAALTANLTDAVLRPRVTMSEAVRAALRIAARAVQEGVRAV